MTNILIVEDDDAISNLILMNLVKEGYSCTRAEDGEKAIELLETRNFDLALLDIMLPKADGFSLLQYMKPTGTPVIFITAMGRTQDRIRGLKLGADDYIVKPFQIGELLARVEAVLRRTGKATMEYWVDDIYINLNSRTVEKNGEPVALTVKEFDLLVEFVRNKNIALYREQLYEKVWNEPFLGETRTLDSHVKRLRQKLGWQEKIKTVFRIGYRLEV